MVGIPGLFFVIACETRARFVRPDPDNKVHTIEVVDQASLSWHGDGHSNPASVPGPPGSPGVTFTRLLAARLDQDFAVDLFSHLVFVGPPDLFLELSNMVSAATYATLHGSLAKDLIDVPDLELWPYLLVWLQQSPASAVPTDPGDEG